MASKLVVAAGFVIFRRIKTDLEYLLLQTSYGEHHWTPPKGHVDPGESEYQTALRETKEEAGLSESHLKVMRDCKKVLHYEVRGKPKKVVYWLAELKDPNTDIVLSEEHIDFKWLNLKDAQSYAKYDEMQKTLKEFDDHLQKSIVRL